MKSSLAASFLVWMTATAYAQCDGQMGTRPTKSGGTMQVCLEPKYSTCVANNRKGGWTQAETQARCDALKAAGKIK
jgi:hypothetical protein